MSECGQTELRNLHTVGSLGDGVEVVDHLIPVGQTAVSAHGKAEELLGTWDLDGLLGACGEHQPHRDHKKHDSGSRVSPVHNRLVYRESLS